MTMTFELSRALGHEENGIISFVGAGGKSSLLRKLGREWREQGRRFLTTTTTKMFFWQVRDFAPVFCCDYHRGLYHIKRFISQYGYAGWYCKWYAQKVQGVPPEWIDRLFASGLVANVLVEGDGARHKLLKVPGENEPVVPSLNKTVIGVLNLKALGQELTLNVVHHAEKVVGFLGKKQGDIVTPQDYVLLASHERGIFHNAPGERILVLTGGQADNFKAAEEIIARLKEQGKNDKSQEIRRFVVTGGYDKQMKVVCFLT